AHTVGEGRREAHQLVRGELHLVDTGAHRVGHGFQLALHDVLATRLARDGPGIALDRVRVRTRAWSVVHVVALGHDLSVGAEAGVDRFRRLAPGGRPL